jgi:hydroxyacylglutathione hydrolase
VKVDGIVYGNTQVIPLRALDTNYVWLLRRWDQGRGQSVALAVDPSETAVVERTLSRLNWTLAAILTTHHHQDHVGGNLALKNSHHCEVICSERDLSRVPGATKAAHEGELFTIGGFRLETFGIPGHTEGQIAWYLRDDELLFVGDTLFAFGCGRLFEGSAAELYHSLQRIMRLPPTTRLFFGHEYSETNAAFALEIEPNNPEILARLERIRHEIAAQGFATPPLLSEEMATNPFLRVREPEIRRRLNLENASDVEVFATLRKMKDGFKAAL